MIAKKILKPAAVFSSLLVGVAVVAAPNIEVRRDARGAAASPLKAGVGYREARADKPPPGGGDPNLENIKRLCGLLGVSGQFHGSAPAKCGLKKVGREPEAVICATPPPGNTSQTEDSKSRKCEYCVGLEMEEKCNEELRVEASVETAFKLPVYGVQIECDANAKYTAEAKAKIEVQNSKWNSIENGDGTDEAVKYVSSITKSSATSKASINLGGGCKIDGKVVTAEMNAKLALSCEMTSTVTLGSTADRAKKTCESDPEPCESTPETADASVKMQMAIAAPCDGGAPPPPPPPPSMDAGSPPPTSTDAGSPPILDASVNDAQVVVKRWDAWAF